MRRKFIANVEIPEGITCEFTDDVLVCKKGEISLRKKMAVLGTIVKIENGNVVFECPRANKKNIAMIKAHAGHVKNMFKGLEEKFAYKMEVCNVHFPMTVKTEGSNVVISNFLGEKIKRTAQILKDVEVNVNGSELTISAHSIEDAGQTAANIERATKVPKKDRRIFQDGIFITEKPGGII